MKYKDKILKHTNRINDISNSINDFKAKRPRPQADWNEGDLDKLLGMESKLRDAQRALKKVEEEISKKNLVKDHRSGKFVRI